MSQYLLNRIGSCRLFPQSATQLSLSNVLPIVQRTRSLNTATQKAAPKPKPGMTHTAFLTALGRDAAEKVKASSWKELWALDGSALKEAGSPVRDRRYILWCMEKYRQGVELEKVAHPPTPKKKIRGHGPAVQHGKRVR